VAEPQVKLGTPVVMRGWIRTSRFSKNVTFIHIYDGTSDGTLQIVVSPPVSPEMKAQLGIGAAIKVTGELAQSQGAGQELELKCTETDIEIVGACDPSEFPIQKKDTTPEFLRTIPHLRMRTAEFQRIFRARSKISMGIHSVLYKNGFHWIHTPIITASDCEGAGDMFAVATQGQFGLHNESFFDAPAHLTVSGQLEVEAFACAMLKVYTFGPTFRAENSNTKRHASEFWMVEPEAAFSSVKEVMDLAENLIRYLLKICQEGNLLCDEVNNMDFSTPFERVTYTEVQEILVKAVEDGREFEYPVGWGKHLQTEHEKYLAEEVYGRPLFVTDYPIDHKSFYMRLNDDGKTVGCFDLIVPGVGEIIGGSAREERLGKLLEQMERFKIDIDDYDWYVDLRRYGSVPHGGFGLGLERFIMWALGVSNIRDVIPYPRTPGTMS